MNQSWTRFVLLLAVLVLGAQIGAAIYEMTVITPVWAGNPPESVRRWNSVTEITIQPFSYKYPALAALCSTSLILFAVAMNKNTARSWIMLSAIICAAVALATMFYSFPVLQRMIDEHGGSLTDEQIIAQAEQWRDWSAIRLALLAVAWLATVIALLSAPARARLFRSDVSWR